MDIDVVARGQCAALPSDETIGPSWPSGDTSCSVVWGMAGRSLKNAQWDIAGRSISTDNTIGVDHLKALPLM